LFETSNRGPERPRNKTVPHQQRIWERLTGRKENEAPELAPSLQKP